MHIQLNVAKMISNQGGLIQRRLRHLGTCGDSENLQALFTFYMLDWWEAFYLTIHIFPNSGRLHQDTYRNRRELVGLL
jgi:hypothetical protein